MNDHNIKTIFNINTQLITKMEKAIYYFKIQNYDLALRTTTTAIGHINSYVELLYQCEEFFNETQMLFDSKSINDMFNALLEAQENRDYILLSDLYEIQFIPFLYSLQEVIISNMGNIANLENYMYSLGLLKRKYPEIYDQLKKESTDFTVYQKSHEIEYTSSGLFTLAMKDNDRRYYLHSNRNAVMEAYFLAQSWFVESKDTYIIYGLGLGYHIKELVWLGEHFKIEVYESDLINIRLACEFSDIAEIFMISGVTLFYDPDFCQLKKRLASINEKTEFVIHYPSLRNITNLPYKKKLEDYFIQYSSIKNQQMTMNSNFVENIQHYDAPVDVLEQMFAGKDMYIIAAGPSLDKNYLQLHNINRKQAVIVATGTVFHKLLNANIVPDYFIVSDANERVYWQLQGLENKTIPMLFVSTANKKFAANYHGRKYIVLQKGYPQAEEYANDNGFNIYQTGGSVSTAALDIGIRFGCKRIIYLGLDLAFTDNFVHAAETSSRDLESTEELVEVKDINGNLIYTSKVLNIYRNWIENRIRNIDNIEFIDATEGGACIEGMRIAKLNDVINA